MTNTSGVTRTNMVEVKCYATNGDSEVEVFIHYVSSTNTTAIHWVFCQHGDGTYTYIQKPMIINRRFMELADIRI